MSEFYTNVAVKGNNILYRGYKDGEPILRKDKFEPTLFVSCSDESSEFRTLSGNPVSSIKPGSMYDCREFVTKYEGISNFNIYGNTDYIYQYIADKFVGEVDYKQQDVKTMYIDIETTCEDGFPDTEDPTEQIIAITCGTNNEYVCFGLGQYTLPSTEDAHVDCRRFESEEDLIYDFIEYWKENVPDVITGWNVKFFDIPYMVNRISRVLGENYSSKLSPWGIIKEKRIRRMNKEQLAFELIGVAILDYYDLYKVFTYVNQESYRLDHIANVELGEKKLSYEEYETMAEFYKNDFQKFMEYNFRDVVLVQNLEKKMKLIELALALTYSAKVNMVDIFSQVRTWDTIIYHYLNEQKIVIPPKKIKKKDTQYAGAYVKEPITGMHDWIVSLDLNSLYPHLIMQYNISTETKITQPQDFMITPNSVLGEQTEHLKKALKTHTDKNYSVAANGTCYSKNKQGFLPALMEKMYKERKMYKGKMIEAQKLQQQIPKMNMPNLGRHALNEKCKNDIAKYNNFQLVRKIQLNSAYGAIGNQYFRYYDVDMAEAITLSGQLSIRWIADKLNEFLNKTIGTEEYDYVVASDTDSVYLRLGNLVNKVCPSDATKQKVVEFLNKASEEIILPFIKKEYDKLAKIMNAYDNKMVMDRECIADKGIWTAKKRYMMRVYDSEGVRYDEPTLKIMGIETTRSSTPQLVRQQLKDAIRLILTTDERTVIDFIESSKSNFMEQEPEDIAFPRGVNGLDKYKGTTTVYVKSTPIAVKGALLYNDALKKYKVTRKYKKIHSGDKIKFLYLKTPNPIGDQVISFVNRIPLEFDLSEFIDYEKQFEKAFLDPLKTILEKIGWDYERRATLEGLFA